MRAPPTPTACRRPTRSRLRSSTASSWLWRSSGASPRSWRWRQRSSRRSIPPIPLVARLLRGRMLAAVGGEGAADGVAFREAAMVVAADVAFVALVGLDQFALGHFGGSREVGGSRVEQADSGFVPH